MNFKAHLGRRPLGHFEFLLQYVPGVNEEHSKNGFQCDGLYSNKALHKRRSEGLSLETICACAVSGLVLPHTQSPFRRDVCFFRSLTLYFHGQSTVEEVCSTVLKVKLLL